MRKIIAVIGDARVEEDSFKQKIAYETGKAIIDAGYRLQCGGLLGVMQAACKGARDSKHYKEGDIIGILPSFDIANCNEYVDIAIPTGLDLYRNVIVANASAVVAIGGGAGTLTEIGNAWALGRLILAYKNIDGWGSKLSDMPLDGRIRYPDVHDDRIYGVETPLQLITIINDKIEIYNKAHQGITMTL